MTRILTRMPIAQHGRVMAPPLITCNARFLRHPSVYPSMRVLLVMDQGRPAIEFGATDTLPPYTFSQTDTRIDKGEHARPETLMLNYLRYKMFRTSK